MVSVKIEYYGDTPVESFISELNDALSPSITLEQFDRKNSDWRFIDELGGDEFFPDFIHLVLIFVSANVLSEFVKSFAGKAGSILAEKLFERIESGRKKVEASAENGQEQDPAERSRPEEYEMMYSFYCHIEEENKTRHSVFEYKAKSYGKPEHGQVNSPERLKKVIADELSKLENGLGSDRWDS